ncbi:MAG TPA: hypothetical protein VJN43_16510 [Bryobacteraceae bacterium]|nr:hypothetical protein [Bryobacteraceae bacterium]
MTPQLADYYRDTDPGALEVFLSCYRQMPAAEKIAAVFQMNEMLWSLVKSGLRKQYPEADDRELFLRTAARFLDRDLMIRVYGWDPAEKP